MVGRLVWWLMIVAVVVLVFAAIFYIGSQGPRDCASEAGVRPDNCVEQTEER